MRTELVYKESHLKIISDIKIQEDVALKALVECYQVLETYFSVNPAFQTSYTPVDVGADQHILLKKMSSASIKTGVGPMASVAGAIAEYVGSKLLKAGARHVVIANGGDIFLKLAKPKKILVYAGSSEFSNKLVLNVQPGETPIGICTSAESVGHSVSLGRADAVVAVSKSTPLADSSATAIANQAGIQTPDELAEFASTIPGLNGFLSIVGGELTCWGNLPKLSKI